MGEKLKPVGTVMIALLLFFLAAVINRFWAVSWTSWIYLFSIIIGLFGCLWFAYDTWIK